MSKTPPAWMTRFFRWFCREDLADAVEGDLHEVYTRRFQKRGSFLANLGFFIQILTFFQPFAVRRKRPGPINFFDMLKLNFKLAFRNLFKTGFYSMINMVSLATGVVAVILLMAFISKELSYDKMHADGDRIYRFGYQLETENQPTRQLAWVSALVAPEARASYPEVEHIARVRNCQGTMIGPNRDFYLEDKGFFAGEDFFSIFNFPLLAGDAATALDAPDKLVLTQSMARKYFGEENALGKQLELRMGDTLNLQVSAVIKDLPDNVHFSFDYLISHKTRERLYPHIQGWFALGTHTYFKLAEGADPEAFEAKASRMVMDTYGEEARSIGFEISLFTQPLLNVHLKSKLSNEIEPNGDIQYIYIAGGIAAILLLITAFNFVNLSVARSYRFIRQLGIRKVMGAKRGQLITQFVTDSWLSVLLALTVGVGLAWWLLPFFSEMISRELSLPWTGWLSISSLAVFLSVFAWLAGAYPIWTTRRMGTVEAVKGKTAGGFKRNYTKQGLIALQFGLATLLICAVLVIRGQLSYMINSSLGFDHEQVAVIELWNNRQARSNTDILKNAMLEIPGVSQVTASNSIPGELLLNRVGYPDNNEALSKVMFSLMIQDDFLELYGLDVVEGRSFSPEMVTDENMAFLINESAVAEFGWTNAEAIDRDFQWGSRAGKIVGVVKDFHYYSLQEQIPPMILLPTDAGVGYLSLKVGGDLSATLEQIEDRWHSLYPDQVFDIFFLEDHFNTQYQLESQLQELTGLFTTVALLVACFGLFSLAAIHVDQRTKEIGIRKVLGASAWTILILIGRFFLRLILISFIVAIPMALVLSNWWLEDFAYRMNLDPFLFIIAACGAFIVAALTILLQSFKTAAMNPVKTLRYE